jgi:pyruvate formate lyase activating enzyme
MKRWYVMDGRVHAYDLSVGADGPGIRFVVVLAGCPLRCRYCQSPDARYMRNGRVTGVDELISEARMYQAFMQVAGGGLTVGGGEPLLQPRFTAALLRAARDELGLHTAIETSGCLGARADADLLDATDLVLLDIKSWHPDTFRFVTGGGEVAPALLFARRLVERGNRIWLRFVVVPGLTDSESNVEGVARFAALLSTVERVEVLPFHKLGEYKWQEKGLRFPLHDTPVPDEALLDRVRGQFAAEGLAVS